MIPSYLTAKSMNAINGAFIGLTITTTAVRFYARRFQNNPFLAADWLILPALVSFGCCAVIFIYEVHVKLLSYSSPEINESVAAEDMYRSAQMVVVLDVMTVVCLGCVQSSACMFYRSIFCVGKRKNVLNMVIFITLGLIAARTATFTLMSGLKCGTHLQEYMRDPSVEPKYCITFSFYYGFAMTDLIFDIWVLLLPVPSILRLRATLAKKATILGVFLLACGGVAAAITRAVIFAQIYYHGAEGSSWPAHSGVTSTEIEFFMILEAGLAIVAVNMPSIWMQLAKYGPERILRNIRSAISLASNRSKASRRSNNLEGSLRYTSSNAKDPQSSSSLFSTVPFAGRQGETLCMADNGGRDTLLAPPGRIYVNKSYSQVTPSQNSTQE